MLFLRKGKREEKESDRKREREREREEDLRHRACVLFMNHK
jgi:hypothetical protein